MLCFICTTNFFFPLVDSPYLQGRIGVSYVLSDLYAKGVSHCDFVLMLLAVYRDMTPSNATICTCEMVHGFNNACLDAGTVVTRGQTLVNLWPVIRGVTMTIYCEGKYVRSDGDCVHDVVVLTKPLGIQVVVNVHEWQRGGTTKWREIEDRVILSVKDSKDMMHVACCLVARLNQNAGRRMVKYHAHAGTDVTGFGLVGHAQNLMDNQIEEVGLEIHTLPCISNTVKIEMAKTLGGLLTCMSNDNAVLYMKELKELAGEPSWIIGRVLQIPGGR